MQPMIHQQKQQQPSSQSSSSLRDLWSRSSTSFPSHAHPHSHIPHHQQPPSLMTNQHHHHHHQQPQQPHHHPLDVFASLTTGLSNGLPQHHQHHSQQHQPQQHYDFHSHSHSSSAYAPPPGLSLPPRPPVPQPPQNMSEWQEGLKALLPNVNVRFVSELDQQSRWPTSGFGLEIGRQSHQMPHSIPPPPGFSVPNR